MTYDAPVAEQMEVRLEIGLLTISDGQGTASAQGFTIESEEAF